MIDAVDGPDSSNRDALAAQSVSQLSIARYRFTARPHDKLDLPEYAGSMLRSVFGLALRNSACVTGQSECQPCPLWRSCPYPAIFETPPKPTQFSGGFSSVPNPFVIEPPPIGTLSISEGQTLVFHMVMIGPRTVSQLPLVIRAWQLALRQGVGPKRVPASLSDVALIDSLGNATLVWDEQSERVLPHYPRLPLSYPTSTAVTSVALNIHTPMRLQQNGRALAGHELSVRTLLSHLLRRINLMLDLHMDLRPAPFEVHQLLTVAESIEDDRKGLSWFDWTRYSTRQRQEMTLGGVLGPWVLSGDVVPLIPWLTLGQWLHVGKNATMGMGGYQLVDHSGNQAT
jgi:hypothetical protein